MSSKSHFISAVLAPIAIGIVVMGAGIASGETSATNANATEGELPAGPGKEVMARVCSGCHAPEVVLNQSTNRAGWKELVLAMVDRGAVASDAEVDQIIDYLSTAVTASAPASSGLRQ